MINFFKNLLKKKSYQSLFLGVILLIITIVFGFRSFLYLDPDYGWHVRLGEEILKKGISRTDPFSYTMPSYSFIDHEWLSNILIHQMSLLGRIPLAIVFALLPVFALLILLPMNLNSAFVLVVLLSSTVILPYSGIRPQVETWIFIGVIFLLFENKKYWKRYSKFLPGLFILWANLHGGFFIGIGILTVFIFFKSFAKKKIIKADVVVLTTCYLATLVNPYGVFLWWEVWMQLTDFNLGSTIKEWMPIFVNFSIWQRFSLILFFIIFSTGIFIKFKKIPKVMLVIYICLIVAAVLSRRHIPIFILGSSLFLYRFLKDFKKLTIVLLIFFIPICFVQNKKTIANSYMEMEDFNYPKNALKFLDQNKIPGETFSSYGWGGYLIWKNPQEKVFIDGRMPSWRRDREIKNESKQAFIEFQQVLKDQNLEQILDKYQISQVVWPIKSLYKIKNRDNLIILTGSEDLREKTDFIEHLLKLGWKQVYRDYITVIYQRPSS